MKKILAIVLLSLLIFCSCNKTEEQYVTDSQETTEIDIDTMSEREIVCWATIIRYNGANYVSAYEIAPEIGAELGTVEYNIPEYYENDMEIPKGSNSATFTPVGEKIYECEGYSPDFRICAKITDYDEPLIFTRSYTLDGELPVFRETIPNSNQIKKLTYCDAKDNVLCEIENKKYYIDTLWTCFEWSEYVPYENMKSYAKQNSIKIEYTDGSTSYIPVFEGGYANFIDYILIPDEFFELIEEVMAGKSIAGRYEMVDWADVICYNGRYYDNIYSDVAPVAGEKLGEVEYSIVEHYEKGEEAPADGISATFTKVGTNVYACKGYSPEFRICARGISSFNIYETRVAGDISMAELLPSAEQIRKIIAEKWNSDIYEYELFGCIENAEHIKKLHSLLTEITHSNGLTDEPHNMYKITLEYIDGTKTDFIAYDHGYGHFMGHAIIPKEFFDALEKALNASVS
ncbi:MAG: hypothetical protein IKJ91_09740 [Clostridia bacterium]|nr:hypothetical protein [Clostridia bacterium]